MSPTSPSIPGSLNLGVIDGIPALELLEGLGELHESVVVSDRTGRVLWTSRALDRLAGGRAEAIDKPLATLCQRFAETQRPDALVHAGDFEDMSARLEFLLDRLDDCETVVQFALTTTSAIELSGFRVESRLEAPAGEAARTTLPLYVVILRERRSTSSAGDHALLDRHPEATLILDPRGFISYANPQALALLGAHGSRVADSPISAHLPLKALAPVSSDGNRADRPLRRVVEIEGGEGGRRWIEVSLRSLDAAGDGGTTGWVLSLRDATSDQHTIDRLRHKVRSLESYVHTVSHDLRSPLVSLLGFTRLLKKEHAGALDPMGRRFVERIEQAGSNMNRMIRDLLELSKRAREGDGARPLVDPRAVLLEIQAELKPRLQDLDIELHLPSAPPMIQCAPTPLYQIFSNLIGNAVLHMGPVRDARIDVLIAEAPNKRVLIVKDNGRGIEDSLQQKIFDAFESIPRPHCEPSTGVGLSIVKKIAQAHGGDVVVDSTPGEGASFTVTIAHD